VISGSGATGSEANITGGNGGAGGKASVATTFSGGNGNGGGGGSGVVDTGANLTNTFTITGGTGGAGGSDGVANRGGIGGNGGAGVRGSSFTLLNSGTIQGGNGGATGAPGSVAEGAGGVGIAGSDLQIVNLNAGTIAGGMSGSRVQANAITFTGGTNSLEIDFGSNIVGNVMAFSTADRFALGGLTSATFDVSQLGAQYQGFGQYQKTGSSTWTLVGSTATTTPWTITAGTLQVAADNNLGAEP
jgi:fibronectin-binding autotransporter adhesin